MLYRYTASDKNGVVSEGDVDAESLDSVLQHLAVKELRPISVQAVKEEKIGLHRAFGSIKISDKVFLTKYLSLMLKVGTDLLSAINILIADFRKAVVKNFLLEVRENLISGRPFYQAFERYPKYFSLVFVNLVKAAEASGNLQQTFEDLSTSLAREADLRGRIRSAAIYPVVLLVVAFALFSFISVFALPRVAEIFEQGGVDPPIFSRIVFGVGLFFRDHIVVIVSAVLVCATGGTYFVLRTVVGRRTASRILSRMPLIHRIYREVAIQRFASTLSSLMRAGLPIVQAIEITADTVGSEEFRSALLRVSRDGLAKGLTIGDAFRRESVFPRVVTNLVAISEKAGHLDEILETLGEFYTASIESSIKALVSALEPILLMVMGLLVAILALSVIVPIYQLTTQF